MASAITHGLVGLALGKVYTGERMPARFWVLSAACAVLPDADAIGFWLGVPYPSLFGHRGFSHSLLFAALTGLIVVRLAFWNQGRSRQKLWSLAVFFALVTASHGVLDALTDGGLGVAFFSPFEQGRYFFPFRPLRTSPVAVGKFFEHAAMILANEAVWVLAPSVALAVLAIAARWVLGRPAADSASP